MPADLDAFAAFVGIDWADDHHDIAVWTEAAAAVETTRLVHTPAALAQWLAQLAQRFASRPIAIALETSRGPLVQALLEAPFVVLYPVNPRSLRRFREVFSPNGAKDDVPDARLLLELVVKHRDHLHVWRPADPETRALQYLVEQRRTAVALRTELTQQLQAALKEYFPQALAWASADLTTPMACHFLQHGLPSRPCSGRGRRRCGASTPAMAAGTRRALRRASARSPPRRH